jgi:hypothetical protein
MMAFSTGGKAIITETTIKDDNIYEMYDHLSFISLGKGGKH